jgi:hypothetical protein
MFFRGISQKELKLELHSDKVFIKAFASGVDFLRWVYFPHHLILRTSTKRRMLRNLESNSRLETTQSYLGMLEHGDTHQLRKEIKNFNARKRRNTHIAKITPFFPQERHFIVKIMSKMGSNMV